MNFHLVTPFGDIEPFLALGAALRAAGHGGTLLAEPRHQTAAAQAQLAFAPLARTGIDAGGNGLAATTPAAAEEVRELESLYGELSPGLDELLRSTLARLPEHDVLVYSHSFPFLKCAAGKLGRKSAALVFSPENVPSVEKGPAETRPAPAWAPKFYRRFESTRAWMAKQKQLDAVVNRATATALQAHGLAPLSGFLFAPADRALITVSPALFPPAAPVTDKYVHTGFLRWDAPMDEHLADLAPVVKVEQTGQALPVLAMDSGKNDFPRLLAKWPKGAPLVVLTTDAVAIADRQRPEILFVHGVPRELLFSLATVVIHDGGAGATAAALHAGRPQLIIPQLASQQHWARAAKQLGVAKILPRPGWADALPAAMAEVLRDVTMPRRAVECASLIRAENGAAQAVRELEKLKV